MVDVNWGLVILIVLALLINVVGLRMLLGKRSNKDKLRIVELENQLADARKDLEVYRAKVNDHFMKTSMLFGQMTDSYKAVFMHLAEGSQNLCTSDAALLKPSGSEFLILSHEEEKTFLETDVPEQEVEEPLSSPGAVSAREDADGTASALEAAEPEELRGDGTHKKSEPVEDPSEAARKTSGPVEETEEKMQG